MAHVLNIVNGATTTELAENATNKIYLLGYVPKTPELDSVEHISNVADGGEMPINLYRNVTETVEILITAANRTAFGNTVAQIEKACQQAIFRQRNRTATPVYVHFQPHGYADAYRSEILTMALDFDEEALAHQWINVKVEATITWRRRYFWENTTETTIPLSNGSASLTTSPITIYNHDDGDVNHDNWVEIASGGIGGTIPTPIRLEYTNTHSTSAIKHLYVWQNVFSEPADLVVIKEAEDANEGSNSALATASNGNYRSRNSTTTAESELLTWNITSAQASKMMGNPFMFLLRLAIDPVATTVKYWIKIVDTTDGTVYWQGDKIQAVSGQQVYDLGSTMLPPGLRGIDADVSGFQIKLFAQNTVSATNAHGIDFIAICSLDGIKKYTSLSATGLENGNILVDDGMTGNLYMQVSAGGVKKTRFTSKTTPLMVYPGRVQRFHFLAVNLTDDCDIARTATINMYARARRLAL